MLLEAASGIADSQCRLRQVRVCLRVPGDGLRLLAAGPVLPGAHFWRERFPLDCARLRRLGTCGFLHLDTGPAAGSCRVVLRFNAPGVVSCEAACPARGPARRLGAGKQPQVPPRPARRSAMWSCASTTWWAASRSSTSGTRCSWRSAGVARASRRAARTPHAAAPSSCSPRSATASRQAPRSDPNQLAECTAPWAPRAPSCRVHAPRHHRPRHRAARRRVSTHFKRGLKACWRARQ
jgi:hypothetical protein